MGSTSSPTTCARAAGGGIAAHVLLTRPDWPDLKPMPCRLTSGGDAPVGQERRLAGTLAGDDPLPGRAGTLHLPAQL